jgi:hypothetical protein
LAGLIFATVSVYKPAGEELLSGAVAMTSESCKKRWVTPVLEKVEMADTACVNAMSMKNNEPSESGNCGSGPGS